MPVYLNMPAHPSLIKALLTLINITTTTLTLVTRLTLHLLTLTATHNPTIPTRSTLTLLPVTPLTLITQTLTLGRTCYRGNGRRGHSCGGRVRAADVHGEGPEAEGALPPSNSHRECSEAEALSYC